MDFVLPGAISLARALLALARSEQSGVLHVSSASGRFELVVEQGVVRALRGGEGDRHGLGDALLRIGALDCVRYSEALARQAPDGPIGAWLVRHGCTTQAAVDYVLRAQLRERVRALLVARGLEYRFRREAVVAEDDWLSAPLGAADLVLFGLRDVYAERDVRSDCASVPAGTLCLTSLGHSLVRDAALWPDELAVTELLRRGTELKRILATVGEETRGARFLVIANALGAVGVQQARQTQYALLLQKLRQSRQRVSASALLGVAAGSSQIDARRAYQRLASQLHPDTLGADVPAELRAASHEVMSALNAAEQRLRRSGLRR